MGKYMRKAKAAAEVAVMDVPVSQSSLGVRTRARTLALQRLQQKSQPCPTSGSSYLQLRSRRLEKPPVGVNDSSRRTKQGHGTAKEKDGCPQNSRARVKVATEDSGARGSGPKKENSGKEKDKEIVVQDNDNDLDVEASFGENVLDCEGRERSTRESTPSSLIRDPETIRTPGSSNRPTSTVENRSTESCPRRHIPTAREMDQFFADAEEKQRRQFIEKYNYDPVNDKPLPGNFKWKQVDHP